MNDSDRETLVERAREVGMVVSRLLADPDGRTDPSDAERREHARRIVRVRERAQREWTVE